MKKTEMGIILNYVSPFCRIVAIQGRSAIMKGSSNEKLTGIDTVEQTDDGWEENPYD